MEPIPAIEGQRLTKIYPSGSSRVVAIQDASLRLFRGEVVALLGPSGAGKTTLLMALGLVNPPSSGQVILDGTLILDGPRPLVNLRALRRKQVGYVFQKHNLVPFLTARENVQLLLQWNRWPAGRARRRAAELLDRLSVARQADHYPPALSSGQQQRVAIARALANRPSILLADEPTAALDGARGRQVMLMFRDAARQFHAAVLVVTHDHRALDVFDRILEMEDGRLRVSPS